MSKLKKWTLYDARYVDVIRIFIWRAVESLTKIQSAKQIKFHLRLGPVRLTKMI